MMQKNFDEKTITYIVDRAPAKIPNLSAVSSPSGIVLAGSAVEGM